MNLRPAFVLPLLILLAPGRTGAQTSELWADFIANWSPGGEWTYDVNPGFAKGLSGSSVLDLYLASTATYQPTNWVSTEGNLEFHYTFDSATEDVIEIRPWLGLNLIWATFGEYLNAFYPSFSIRLEERLFWYQSSGIDDAKTRARFRIFTRFPLNNPTLVEGTYYLLLLAETYVPLNGEPRELSADRRRFQGGLGYVLEPRLRIELQYVIMRTRNTYSNEFEANSNIVWLAVRNFF